MPFRFRRSSPVGPGLRINLSKSGVSESIGRRGAWFTIGPRERARRSGYLVVGSATPRSRGPVARWC
jgi:uncharacterized protein DUF4236